MMNASKLCNITLTKKGSSPFSFAKVIGTLFVILGTADGIKEAKQFLKSLQDGSEIKQHTIKYPKVRKYLACIQGQECVKKVQINTPCIIDTRGSSRIATFDKSTTYAEATLKSGVKVIVVGGDITELQVDVLVYAASREMKHAWRLARVIVNKGGQKIQTECDNRIRTKGLLSKGDVFMGEGGKLKCKFVAHAFGPAWEGGGNGEELCLQKAVYTCIEKAEKRNLKSISMPALSGGMFQYPVHLSCMAIVKAVEQHFQGTRSSIKEVYLCDISKVTVDAFTRALQAVVSDVKVHGCYQSEDREEPPKRQSRHQDKHHSPQRHDDSEDSCIITIYAEDTNKVNKAVTSFERPFRKNGY